MKHVSYIINITNWDKYNGSLKRGHKNIMLSTGFLSDSKIRKLSPTTKLMYLSFLLVAGESTQSQISVSHDSIVFQSGVKSGSIQSQLDLLQSLQLLTYEKEDPFIIEKKRKERNIRGIEMPAPPAAENHQLSEPKIPEKNSSETLLKIWNENRGSLPEALALNKARKAKSLQRWKEFPDESFWIAVVQRLAKSPFCNGENGQSWRANFDFFIQPNTHLKVNEGQYDSKKKQGPVGIVGSSR